MPIHFEHSIDLSQSPQKVFALLDDLSKTPQWLTRCTGIEVLTPGEKTVGTRLRYSYREGRRSGSMEGQIVERRPNERLGYRYEDKMMQVAVAFAMAPAGQGTRLTHTIDIQPRSFLAKLFSPMIRRQLPAQTIGSMQNLHRLLESQS